MIKVIQQQCLMFEHLTFRCIHPECQDNTKEVVFNG